jgi:putative two-component system response regulator
VINTILLIDDEPYNRNAIVRMFEEYEFEFVECGNGKEGLDALQRQKYDLILLDIKMPVMDGFEFLAHYSDSELKPKPPVCVMTALDDSQTRKKAIYLGADDFISKPLDTVELETRIASLLRISNFQQDLYILNKNLEKRVLDRTAQLQTTLKKLKETEKDNARAYREMITRISSLSEFGNTPYRPSSKKLGLCCSTLGWLYGLSAIEADNLRLSSQLYDIGMLALPERLRETPPEQLNTDEMNVYSSHTILGSKLFDDSDISLLKQAHNICLYHHEHYDGSGLPKHLKGDTIPIEARLFAAARLIIETIEHFPENASYYTLSALKEHSGTLLDPAIVDLLIDSKDSIDSLVQELR